MWEKYGVRFGSFSRAEGNGEERKKTNKNYNKQQQKKQKWQRDLRTPTIRQKLWRSKFYTEVPESLFFDFRGLAQEPQWYFPIEVNGSMQGFNLKHLETVFRKTKKVGQQKSLIFTPDVWSQWNGPWNRSKTLVRAFEKSYQIFLQVFHDKEFHKLLCLEIVK